MHPLQWNPSITPLLTRQARPQFGSESANPYQPLTQKLDALSVGLINRAPLAPKLRDILDAASSFQGPNEDDAVRKSAIYLGNAFIGSPQQKPSASALIPFYVNTIAPLLSNLPDRERFLIQSHILTLQRLFLYPPAPNQDAAQRTAQFA